jgi:hypothetical protein
MPINSLGTYNRTKDSINVGSAGFALSGSLSRVAAWQKNNPPLPGSTPYVPQSNGGYGGGGGAGAPQYKANGAGNGYPGGNGGQGLVCIWANINQTNTTPSISGIIDPSAGIIPPAVPGTTATLNVISGNTSAISSNSAYPNNPNGITSVVFQNETYYVIYLAPGTFTIETNLSTISLLMCGGGGGGAGGPALENDNALIAGAGGGGGAILGATFYLYTVDSTQDNNLGLTTTLTVSVGSGGSGGAGGYKNPSGSQNYSGYAGNSGGSTTVTISQTGPYAQFSENINLNCNGGSFGQNASGNTSSSNSSKTAQGGSGGNPSASNLSTEGWSLINACLYGGNGGNGSSGNNVICYGYGATFTQLNPNIPSNSNMVFSIPAYNSQIPYVGSSASFNATQVTSAAAINMGGGGGGGLAWLNNQDQTTTTGGNGAGGNGGAVNITSNKNILLEVIDWITNEAIGGLGLDDPATYVSLIFDGLDEVVPTVTQSTVKQFQSTPPSSNDANSYAIFYGEHSANSPTFYNMWSRR